MSDVTPERIEFGRFAVVAVADEWPDVALFSEAELSAPDPKVKMTVQGDVVRFRPDNGFATYVVQRDVPAPEGHVVAIRHESLYVQPRGELVGATDG